MASSGAGASGESIVVGSANFPESELLADIYAEALKAKGVAVTTKLNIASRETYVPVSYTHLDVYKRQTSTRR